MVNKTILHYHIIEQLGAGGMGVVYLADDKKLNRKVALKFLPVHIASLADDRRRFKAEAQAAAALNHPNIASIYAIEETDDYIFIAMEYVEGSELKTLIENDKISRPDKNLNPEKIILQIAEGLKAAHSKGIVHRDIKSSNIMVTAAGQVKIMDFGLAKISGGEELTQVGATVGTTGYMAPEQIRAEEVSPATDIWALGVIICELLTKQLPFRGAYEQAVFYSILNEDAPKLIELSDNAESALFQNIYQRCLKKNPQERYQDLQQLIDDLHNGSDTVTKEIPLKPLIQKEPVKKKYAIPFTVIIVVLALVWIIFKNYDKWFTSLPSEQHVAVLPFEMINGDPEKTAFCDGLVETMTSKLTQMEQFHGTLWVVPASEIRRNKVQSAKDAQIAFGVNLVVSGSLQIMKDLIRLTINLIDAAEMRQLNSAVIDVSSNKLASLQDKSVTELLKLIKIQLNPESVKIISAGTTTVPGAYEFYLQGIGYLQRYESNNNLETAVKLFSQAVELDSSYALAYAGLGESYWRLYESQREKKWIDLANSASEKAIRINADLPEANNSLGLVYAGTGRYREAIDVFDRALANDPTNAAALRGTAAAYEAQQQMDKAESVYKRAIALKPDYWGGYNALGVLYFKQGKYEEAITQFRQVIKLTPDNARGYSNLGGIYYMIKRLPEAKEMFEKSLDIKKTYRVCSNLGTLYYIEQKYDEAAYMYEMALELNKADYRIWGNLASAYFRSTKNKTKAPSIYQKAIDLAEEMRNVNPSVSDVVADIAGYYSMLGQKEKALSYLKEAQQQDQNNAYVAYVSGTTYEQLGERDKAIEWLVKAVKEGYSLGEIESQPELLNVVNDPKYKLQIKG